MIISFKNNFIFLKIKLKHKKICLILQNISNTKIYCYKFYITIKVSLIYSSLVYEPLNINLISSRIRDYNINNINNINK